MSRTQLGTKGSSRLRRVLGLGISGAALVGMVYFEGVSARAEEGDALEASARADEELDEELAPEDDEAAEIAVPKRAEPKVAAPGPAAPPEPVEPVEPVLVAMADVGALEAAAAEMPADPPAPALVAVPDLKGKSLRKARKELKALGLELSVRDEWGYKIHRSDWGYYKVRSQKIEAGTVVEPGSRVRVKARERYQASMGY